MLLDLNLRTNFFISVFTIAIFFISQFPFSNPHSNLANLNIFISDLDSMIQKTSENKFSKKKLIVSVSLV